MRVYTDEVQLRVAAALFVGGLLSLAPAGTADQGAPPVRFEAAIDVALSTVVVRVVDTWGQPILALSPKDFRVRVGTVEVPVVAVDWTSGEEPAPVAPAPVEGLTTTPAPAHPAGRLMVFFVQADLNSTRISGQLRLRPHTRELLATLHPDDQIAVVSYDSHLKLRQDFTRDRDIAYAAMDEAMLWGEERQIAPDGPDSLAGHFDFAAARAAASPERALEVTAQALAPLPGEKTLIYLGWGLGRFGGDGVRMTPAYAPAVRALGAARASVFVLDVTSADSHSLEVGLQAIVDATGGVYLKTFRLPGLATRTLAKAISGYYVLTLDRSQLPAKGTGELRIELRDKRGTVVARPAVLRGAG
jgi:VWFA-related protein